MKTILTAKLELPFVESFGDYHEIEYKRNDLREIFGNQVKSKELPFDGCYWGLFYVGKLTDKSEIDKMLIKAGWGTT